jgi:hypothetical protein
LLILCMKTYLFRVFHPFLAPFSKFHARQHPKFECFLWLVYRCRDPNLSNVNLCTLKFGLSEKETLFSWTPGWMQKGKKSNALINVVLYIHYSSGKIVWMVAWCFKPQPSEGPPPQAQPQQQWASPHIALLDSFNFSTTLHNNYDQGAHHHYNLFLVFSLWSQSEIESIDFPFLPSFCANPFSPSAWSLLCC